jgi:hypothetical protein
MLGIPNPLGRPIGGVAELVDMLRVLPQIAENTASMAKATRTLPGIERKLAEIEEAVVQMDGRMANIEAAMPVLREVETTLEELRIEMAPLQDVGRLVRRIPGGRVAGGGEGRE